MPGDVHPPFADVEIARQVLNDAEADLRDYELHVEPIVSQSGHLGVGAMPGNVNTDVVGQQQAGFSQTSSSRSVSGEEQYEGSHAQTPYLTDAERVERQEAAQQREMSTAV